MTHLLIYVTAELLLLSHNTRNVRNDGQNSSDGTFTYLENTCHWKQHETRKTNQSRKQKQNNWWLVLSEDLLQGLLTMTTSIPVSVMWTAAVKPIHRVNLAKEEGRGTFLSSGHFLDRSHKNVWILINPKQQTLAAAWKYQTIELCQQILNIKSPS